MIRGSTILLMIGGAVLAAMALDAYSSRPAVQESAAVEDSVPAAAGRTVRLRADARGHFLVRATINGRSIDMLADTGSSAVALTMSDARRAGFDPRSLDFDTPVQTANGEVRVASVTLDRIDVEGIVLRDVRAVVAADEALASSLLGMSFLGRLASVKMSGDTLELVQ